MLHSIVDTKTAYGIALLLHFIVVLNPYTVEYELGEINSRVGTIPLRHTEFGYLNYKLNKPSDVSPKSPPICQKFSCFYIKRY